jgi:mycofactocin system glycosyltransferase
VADASGGELLPAGWRLTFDPSTRRADGGRAVIGGTPLRILRLSAAGASLVDRLEAGDPVPDGTAARALARRLVDAAIAHPAPPPGAGPTPDDVTVVIPVLDDAAGLARALAALGPAARVVVVDDGSAVPIEVPDGVTLLRHDRPLGPAAARNTGWRHATTEVVAFVDADVEPDAGWLERLLGHLGDPATAAAAPRIHSTQGAAPRWLASYEADRSSLDLGPAPAPVRPGSRVPYVPTAVLVVRRGALEELGGFDEAMHVGEDVDLVWRLAAAGHRLRYEPAAGATHPARPTTSAWLRQRFRYGTAAADLAARHGDAVAPLHISGWSAAAWTLVGLGHPVAGAALAAGTTVALTPKLRALDRPFAEAVRIAGTGNLYAGRAVADALRRPWWPAAVALGVARPRSRPALLAAAVLPALLEQRSARHVAARLADDVAYGTGVLAGCWRRRSARALRPALTGPFRASDN